MKAKNPKGLAVSERLKAVLYEIVLLHLLHFVRMNVCCV